MDCSKCKHRQWEEGDHSETPPGHGVYYCVLTRYSYLEESVAKGFKRPINCPIQPNLMPGNVWKHTNGNNYVILHLANINISLDKIDEYPMTVVYTVEGLQTGEVYAKKPQEFILNRTHVNHDAQINTNLV